MRRPWILPSLVLLALLCVAASALAQGDERFVGVLGPDAEGGRLQAQAEGDSVCVRLAGQNGSDSEVCSDISGPDLFGPLVIDLTLERDGRPTSVGGAVRAGVARVEYVTADGRTFATDTVAAPQVGGRAGSELRFFLMTLPAGADPVTRRLLDAAGQLVGESDDVGSVGTGAAPRPLRGPVRLARGRSNGADWSLYATLRNVLEPVRGDVGRRQPRLCLATSREPSGVGSCEEGPERTFSYDVSSGCTGRLASLLLGVAGPGVRIEVRLGDGRWRPARMLMPPAGYAPAGERAWVFAIPADAAVRSIRGRAADGHVLLTTPFGLAPPRLGCENGELSGFFTSDDETPPPLTGPETILSPPGGPPLHVADADAQLCVALGPAPSDRSCDLPAPGAAEFVIATDGASMGGAVDPAVASVEARTVAGRRVRVATDPGAAYAGRYAGRLRFFSLTAPGGRTIESFTLRDAAGKRIIDFPLGFDVGRVGRSRVLLSGRAAGGRYDVSQATFRLTGLGRSVRCLAVTRRGKSLRDPFDCIALTPRGRRLDTSSLGGTVRCDLRAAFLVGGASARAASVRARLDDGSTVAGRLFGSALGRAFLVSPPARRGLRRVEVLDRAGKVLAAYVAPVPPAGRQCGYSFTVDRAGARSARAARLVRPAVPGRVGQPYAAYRSNRLTAWQWQRR